MSQGTVSSEKKVNKVHEKTEKYFDYSLLFIVIFLVCFGLVMIYSTSAYNSQIVNDGDSFYYLKRQAMLAGIGMVLLFVASSVPYTFWKRFTLLAYVGINAMLLLVLVSGVASHGQKRWIALGPIQFQPSEMAKAILIVFLAHLATNRIKQLKTGMGVIKCFLWTLPMIVLVTISNLSTGIILLGITFIILFVASNQYKIFFGVIAGGVSMMVVF